MKNLMLLPITFILMLQTVHAQYQFEIFTDDDGLPDKRVRGLDVDGENTLWIGTRKGLAKWDGQEFTAVPTKDSVASPFCNVVRVAPNGNIWVGYFTSPTEGGISVYSPDGALVMHADTSNANLGSNLITDIEFDENGMAWIAHFAGITTFDGMEWNFMPPAMDNYSAAPVHDIQFDGNGGYYASTIIGLMHFNGSQWAYNTIFNTNIIHNDVRKAAIATDGRTWVGTRGGLSILDNGFFENYISADGLPDEFIRDIQFDTLGNVWLATDDGFAVFDGDTFDNYKTSMDNFFDNTIDDILIHDELGIWMTTREGLVRVTDGSVPVFEKRDLNDFEMSIHPNVIKNGQGVNFSVFGLAEGEGRVLVFDSIGRPVFSKKIMMWGQKEFSLYLPDLEEGMYILQMQKGNDMGIGQRFFVIDK